MARGVVRFGFQAAHGHCLNAKRVAERPSDVSLVLSVGGSLESTTWINMCRAMTLKNKRADMVCCVVVHEVLGSDISLVICFFRAANFIFRRFGRVRTSGHWHCDTDIWTSPERSENSSNTSELLQDVSVRLRIFANQMQIRRAYPWLWRVCISSGHASMEM